MKVYNLLFIFVILLFTAMCSREQVQSDIFVEKEYSFSNVSNVAIGSIQSRASISFLKENFRDQLEFHFLKRGYNVVGLSGAGSSEGAKPFDLSVDASLYEELDEDLRGGYHSHHGINHIVVQLSFHNPSGEKVSVVRYMYRGRSSLASGNFMNNVISSIFNKIE